LFASFEVVYLSTSVPLMPMVVLAAAQCSRQKIWELVSGRGVLATFVAEPAFVCADWGL
jgi:hypothetical protein